MNELKPGQLIDGKYEISALLGSGAYGAVYKAYHQELSRTVAIKVLGVRGDLTEDTRLRFSREARLLSALSHPNIIGVFSYGILENSIPYIVMEYLDGRTLAERLRDDEPLPPNVLLEIFAQVSSGLATAHAAGVIHRDLKPENIFLAHSEGSGPGFTAKILDFGLSRQFEDGLSTSQRLTQTGALLGSVHYMSPEAAAGRPVDARSDIYSLGCILYQCVAGALPYDADSPLGILYKQQNESIPPISQKRLEAAPNGIELLIQKAMHKDSDARFQSAEELIGALNAIKVQDMQLLNALCELDSSGGPQPDQKKAFWIAGIAATVIVCLVTVAVLYMVPPSSKNPSVTEVSEGSKHNAKIRSGDLMVLKKRFSKAHSDLFNLEIKSARAELVAIEQELAELQPSLRIKSKLVDCIITRASIMRDRARLEDAAALFEQAIKESRLPSGKRTNEEIGIRTSLAETRMDLHDTAEAEKLVLQNIEDIKEVTAAYERGEETPELKSTDTWEIGMSGALSKMILAKIEYNRGEYQKSLKHADESAFYMEGRGIMDGANTMRFLMGNCYLKLNQRDKALKTVDEFGKKIGDLNHFKKGLESNEMRSAHILNCVHILEATSGWFAAYGFPQESKEYRMLAQEVRQLVAESKKP